MTSINNYGTAKQKLAKIWEQTEANRVQIDVQLSSQEAVIKELNKTQFRTFDNNQILNLDSSFLSPIPLEILGNGNANSVYQTWEVEFTGITMEELVGCQVNLLFRYGTGNTYLDSQIYLFADITFLKIFSMDNIEDSRLVTKKMLCGLFIDANGGEDGEGLAGYNDKNMQVALNIRFPNPRYFN